MIHLGKHYKDEDGNIVKVCKRLISGEVFCIEVEWVNSPYGYLNSTLLFTINKFKIHFSQLNKLQEILLVEE